MKKMHHLLTLCSLVLLLVGCGAAPMKADKQALAGIRSIALIRVSEPVQ